MGRKKVPTIETFGDSQQGVDKITRYNWAPLVNPGEFLWLPKEELHVDHAYQRDKIHLDRISLIAGSWDWVRCGAISVNIRDNKWWVMDGQHRVLASLKRSDIKKLPCMVFDLENQQAEAQSFVDLNSQKTAVSGVDRYKAMLVAQDPIAVGLSVMFAATGHKVSNSRSAKTVSCIMLLWRMWKRNPEVLQKVWPLIADATIGTTPVDAFVRAIYITEFKANTKGFSLTDQNVRHAILMGGAAVILAEIRRECGIVGRGGERVESAALIKWLNRQRLGSKYKLVVE